MTEHRNTPRFDDDAGDARPASSRRFARLVGHPAARRLALPRLAWAVAVAVGAIALVALGGTRAVRLASGWLHDRPAYRLPIEAVTLVPPPDPWIRSGATTFLDAIRAEADDEGRLSLLDLDLEGLRKALRHCPWVKDVARIERSYGSLAIHLSYYQPAAMASVGGGRLVVDRDAIILPGEDILWDPSDRPFRRLRGRDDPLIQLDGFRLPADPSPRPGSFWGRDDRADPMVVRAARLAEFLAGSARADGPDAIRFDLILPHKPEKAGDPPLGLFARTAEGLYVFWGWSPEAEVAGLPTAAEKWAMLRDWTGRHGPPRVAYPNYVSFLASGLVDRTLTPLEPPAPQKRR